jgi:hypothetical protein
VFIANLLVRRFGDGWNGNVLVFTEDDSGDEVHSLTQSGSIAAHQAEDFEVCFNCGACFSGVTGGGSLTSETSWTLTDESGATVAEAKSGSSSSGTPASFCTECFTTVCEAGKQPNADGGCDACEAGK